VSSTDLKDIRNYLRISDRLVTAGQPTGEQFNAIRAAGYEIVINLDAPAGAPWDEAETVQRLGMDYIHIPVIWESPQQADLDRFFETMDRHRESRLFVHCAANARVSVFLFLYHVIRCGMPVDVARESVWTIWRPNAVWLTFVAESLARFGIGESFS
jgi:protein tyrosine phosphatase (PTP) superfamily phosphohydrolase (DUF442 family)